jgi:CubicO group peptidase (beta-lactamase class C family)
MTIPDTNELQARLERFLKEAECPGTQLGLLVDGEIHTAAAGVLNLDTGVEVTTDSVFQIGSVTKVWTATQVMQLIDAGELTLDTPVRELLPGFTLADADVAAGVTVRHLLTHTSGIEGDVFDDVGTNDDCLERYVDALAALGAVHGLGETWSYCNSGWVLLGRVVETVTGSSWDQALKERLGQPLGLERLCTLPQEAILHRASVGHIKPAGAEAYVVAPQWGLPRALGPAGLITTTVSDLLTFGRMHLEGGRSRTGEQILAPDTVELMHEPHAECPERHLLGDHWGLGWVLREVEGRRLIGHGGNTIGQSAYFQLVPDRGVAVALLTNITGGAVEARRLMNELLSEFADVTLPPPPTPASEPVALELDRFTGAYRRHSVDTVVQRNDGHLTAEITMHGPIAAALGSENPLVIELVPAPQDHEDRVAFVARHPRLGDAWVPVTFYGTTDDGRSKYLHTGARVSVRAGT